MSKGKSTWKYNKLLTGRRNYFLGGSYLNIGNNIIPSVSPDIGGMSGEIYTTEPESVSNLKLSKLGKDILKGVGVAASQIGGGLIGGGLQSGVGNAIQGLTPLTSVLPPGLREAAGAGLGLIGGLTNRMFGSKLNQENIAKVENNINELNSFQSNASDFDGLSQNWSNAVTGLTFDNNYIGKDGWFSNKASDKAKELRNKIAAGNTWVNNTLANNANNIMNTQMQNLLGNYAAFGGELNTQGGDFTNGILAINAGGSHETNPYEGIQMGVDPQGVPNLVEEGETIFNDYVFSNRLNVPKAIRNKYKLRGTKPLTFAEASKILAKESEERPNDPISIKGLEAMMMDLATAQEELRATENNQYSQGGNLFATGGINTYKGLGKSYNRGWFGDDGKYTKEYLDRVNNMTLEQLQAQFDRQREFYNNDANKNTERWQSIDNFYKRNPNYNSVDYKVTDADLAFAKRGAQDYNPGYLHDLVLDATAPNTPANAAKKAAIDRYFEYGTGTQFNDYFTGRNDKGQTWFDLHPDYYLVDKNGTVRDPIDIDGVSTTYTDYFLRKREADKSIEEETPQEWQSGRYNDWLRYAPAVGFGIGALTDTFGLTNTPDYSNANAILEATRGAGTYQPVRFRPIGDYLTYRPFDRDYYLNTANANAAATRRNIINTSGNNRSAAMAGILAADNNALNNIGTLARQAEEYNLAQREKVADFNRNTNITNSEGFLKADIANQSALASQREFNLNGIMAAAKMRDGERLAADQARSSNISGLFDSLGDIGYEEANRRMLDYALAHELFGAGAEDGYAWNRGKKVDKNNTDSTNKSAKGGKINKKKKGLTF